MTLGSLDRRCFRAFVPLLMFAGAAGAQVTTLFSENFEGPPGPPGNVGAYTEVDPFSGVPAPTLWHEGNACGSFPVSNYAVTTSTAPFSSILGGPSTVTLFTSGDDGFSGRIVVPFVYQHFGIAFQLVDVSRNGMLSTFPGAGGGTDFINQAPGTATTPNGVIGAWWDDTFHSTGQTAYAVLGSAPNRQFVVEWNGLEAFPGNGSGENETSQVLIDEGTGVLHFRYDNATFATGGDPWSATCGTESFDGAAGTDATGLGANNSVFPSTGFDLTPLPPAIPPLPACFGTGAATYNQGDIGIFNYDTGVANAGAIESPAAVSTSATATLVMIFDFTKDTEGGGSTSFDQCFVETSPTGLATWTTQVQLSGNTGPCGGPIDTQILVLPASLSGTSFQHRFRFDTVDSVGNNYNGWSVDNIRINQAAGTIAVAYSENFEAGTVPGVTVGNMTEEDPFGTALDTLWHAEANCDGGSPGTYTASVGPAGYTSISGNPSAVLIHGPFTDDSLGIIGVPIAFNFYGAPAATLGVDSNGPVGPGLPFSDFTNDPIPTTFTPNGWVSPWWDDNHTGSTGSVLFDVVGGSLVIEWNVEHYPGANGSGEFISFQLRLNPSPADTIDLLYDPATFVSGTDPWNSTIGIEDASGNGGTDVTGLGASNTAPPASNATLTFVPGGGGGTPIPAPLAGSAAAYNQGNIGTFTYNTGTQNTGTIVSPSFALPGGTIGLTLGFDYLKVTEGGGSTAFDQCFVEARPTGSASWDGMVQIAGNNPCGAGGATASFSTGGPGFSSLVSGGGGNVRLRFDTVDAVGNDYAGWYVDNLSLTAQAVNITPTSGAGCPSSGGCVPTIGTSGLPAAGNSSFAITLGGAQPGTLGVLILSSVTTSIPVSLFIPGNSCTLLVAPTILISPIPVSAGAGCSGAASVGLPIPCGIPAGASLSAQWAVVQVSIFPAPLSVSMTPRITITAL